MGERPTGTREWAPNNFNWMFGCGHGCLYCYACEMACRFKRFADHEEWMKPRLNTKAIARRPRKLDGGIMAPTTHDITPEYLDVSIEVLRKWLGVGNTFLIVSKPHKECIEALTERLAEFRSQIEFRFTIGSTDNDTLRFWEPHAPPLEERLECLRIGVENGYRVSVSCEPYLDAKIGDLVTRLLTMTKGDVWVGKMNKISKRVDMTGWGEREYGFLRAVQSSQTDEAVMALVERFKGERQVVWKDSVKKVIERYANTSHVTL